jgi:exopolyphosphatase/guanosine-5'-triphosphate,3'-diphosphate pyrophosphatase
MKAAELAAREELQPMARGFSRRNWQEAVGSSGTVRAIAEILQLNGFDEGSITPAGVEGLRSYLIKCGDVNRAELAGLKPDRIPVLPGGVAIMGAVLSELDIDSMVAATGAMRQGVLYDMLGRIHRRDMRDVTVAQFMQRYHVDALQARRVGALAQSLYEKLTADAKEVDDSAPLLIAWAAKLHEIGISVSYSGYHKHSAYIIGNADMPGFSRDEQNRLARLVLAHRRSLKKIYDSLNDGNDVVIALALRLAVLFSRGRADVGVPSIQARIQGRKFRFALDGEWLAKNPLTVHALGAEVREWERVGIEIRIPGLDELESASELALAS